MSLEKQVNVQRIVSAFVGHSVDYLRMIHRVQPDDIFLGHSILSIYLFSYLIMYPKCVAAVYKTTGQVNQSLLKVCTIHYQRLRFSQIKDGAEPGSTTDHSQNVLNLKS